MFNKLIGDKMIGIDIVEIVRIENILKLQGFLTKCFTENEREYIKVKNFSPTTIAGIFAAKESVAKALGTGFTNKVFISDIEVLHDEYEKPYVVLTKGAKDKLTALGFKKVSVSISHEKSYAVAMAMCS